MTVKNGEKKMDRLGTYLLGLLFTGGAALTAGSIFSHEKKLRRTETKELTGSGMLDDSVDDLATKAAVAEPVVTPSQPRDRTGEKRAKRHKRQKARGQAGKPRARDACRHTKRASQNGRTEAT